MQRSKRLDLSGPWSILSRAPMVRFSVPMAIGITFARSVDPPFLFMVISFMIITIVAAIILFFQMQHSQRWIRGAVVAGWMFCFGSVWMTIRDASKVPDSIEHQLGNEGPWLVRTITLNRVSPAQIRAD